MASTAHRVLAALGALMGNVQTQAGANVALVEASDGPSFFYQGSCFPDLRYSPLNKDSLKAGRVPSFMNTPWTTVVDAVPSTLGTATIAANQHATSGTAFTLATTAAGASGSASACMVPIIALPANTGVGAFPNAGSVVSVLCPDFGFTQGTYVAGNKTVTVVDSSLFYVGQWIVLGGAGASNTSSVVTQVSGITDATHITVTVAPVAALTNGPIGSANAYGNFPASLAANAANPYLQGGVAAVLNPEEAVARAVSITAAAAASGGHFVIAGYDIFGQAMTENINAGGNTTTNGKKAFKYIASVTPQFTDAQNYSVGTIDVFGIHLRADRFSQVDINWNNGWITANTGFTAADTTSPATTTTGDVRGTYATQSASDGTKRLVIGVSPRLPAQLLTNPGSTNLLFGVPQV